MKLVNRLLDLILPPRASERLLRTIPDDGLVPYLDPRAVRHARHLLPCTALLPYAAPAVQAAIVEAKFHASARAARLLGAVLTKYFADSFIKNAAASGELILVPVPLSRERLRERGYNQVESIAHAAHLPASLPLRSDLLVRTRATQPQTSLGGRERRENVAGCFSAPGPLDPSCRYVVLDDVTTTGATLAAAAEALQRAGARRIHLLALAH